MAWFKKEKSKEEKQTTITPASKPVASSTIVSSTIKAKNSVLHLIRHPHLSEKSNRLQASGQYTFAVIPKASKNELKKEVEQLYGVKVLKITSVKLPRKKIKTRGKFGQRKVRRIMRVSLKPGQTIDLSKA
ncbi:MAG: 50S ribosomal protein L23 [Patescibacteria group bacterium]